MQDLQRVRQDIRFQTRQTFLNALRSAEVINIRRTDLDLAREQLVRIQGRVDAGAAQIGQIYQQEAEIANAELSLEQARTDSLVTRNNLAFLMNVDPTTEFRLSSQGLAESIDSVDLVRMRQQLGSPEELIQQQFDARSDVRAAKLRVESARSQITAARAGYFPSLSAGLGYGWTRSGETSSGDATFSLNFSFTPFDGFRTSEQVQLAEANYQSAQIELRRLELEARSALQGALAKLEGAERQLRAADKAVAAARQNRFAADERYKVGNGAYSDFLLASAQYLTAQINQVNAVFNYRLALYEVQYHLGQ
jgi:outer membrane protein